MRILIGDEARGPLLKLDAPLSFWGGADIELGTIIDRNHPEFGVSMRGVIVVMPHGRGSSSSATVLAEMIRIGSAPAGLIIEELDPILLTGAYVANTLYDARFVVAVGGVASSSDGWYVLDSSGLRPGPSDQGK